MIPRDEKGQFAKGLPRPTARTGKTIKCSRCGKKVYKSKCHLKQEGHNYCSIECWNITQFDNATCKKMAICPNCGKNFVSRKYHKGDKWIQYCCLKCWRIHKGYKGNGRYKKCNYCGKKFWAIPSRELLGRGKYCSKDCQNAHKTALNTLPVRCKSCDESFDKQLSRYYRNLYGFFCSRECWNAYSKKSNCPAWKGGFSFRNTGAYYIAVGFGHSYSGHPNGHLVYKGRGRVIVELLIGRILRQTEGVLHLNGDIGDDRPENLYITSSMSELKKIQAGSLDFPKTSNLNDRTWSIFTSPSIKYLRFDDKEIRQYLQNSHKKTV